jgi:hypothetical protein
MKENKIIAIERRQGPVQILLKRILRMVPDKDKDDRKLHRLLAFRLEIDGEAATTEYLMRKIREIIQCRYAGSLYDYLKCGDAARRCREKNLTSPPPPTPDPPEIAG